MSEQIHEDFIIRTWGTGTDSDPDTYLRYLSGSVLSELRGLVLNAEGMPAGTVCCPRSISLILNRRSITAVLGYTKEPAANKYTVDFRVEPIGVIHDSDARLRVEITECAARAGAIICQDVVQIPGNSSTLYAVFMTRRANADAGEPAAPQALSTTAVTESVSV